MNLKINVRKILLEQSSEWERLPDNEQSSPNELKYERLGCELKKFGTKWFKKCSSPTSSTGLDKYVGKYNPNFTIKLKDGKLYGSGKISDKEFGDVELIPVSGNKFKATISGIDVEINFNESGGLITGGTATAKILGFSETLTFTKASSTTSTPDEPKSDDTSVWSCIEKFNKEFNQVGLLDRDDYRFEEVDLQHNGKDTIFMYYKDGKAVWAYYDNKKPIMYGVWECKGKSGYLIKWSDGVVSRYGTKDSGDRGTSAPTNTNTTTNVLENPCVNGYKEGCVTENDILGKGKALKVCSKCDLIKKVQENPEIKARIFRIQKELGQEQKTDNSFGPIMLAAIKEFQQSHGINPTGMVGEKTLSKINPGYAKSFYLDRGGKKFESGDKTGGSADYFKALQIQDSRDERDGVLYWAVAQGTKDKKAKCSAYIKSVERGYWESAYYYKESKCSEIPGLPSYEELIEKFGSENDDWTPTDKNKPVINKTDVKNEPVINKTDDKSTNKSEVKPIYKRSPRQVLSPDEEL
jgi:peptidoglycan hydrolase-like protein with peptidoglycan-binding domain